MPRRTKQISNLYCAILTCQAKASSLYPKGKETFHRFPNDIELKKKWVELTGRTNWAPDKDSAICSKHFRDEDFTVKRSGDRYLKNGVIPTEYIVYPFIFSDVIPAPEIEQDNEERNVVNQPNNDYNQGYETDNLVENVNRYLNRNNRNSNNREGNAPVRVDPVENIDADDSSSSTDDSDSQSDSDSSSGSDPDLDNDPDVRSVVRDLENEDGIPIRNEDMRGNEENDNANSEAGSYQERETNHNEESNQERDSNYDEESNQESDSNHDEESNQESDSNQDEESNQESDSNQDEDSNHYEDEHSNNGEERVLNHGEGVSIHDEDTQLEPEAEMEYADTSSKDTDYSLLVSPSVNNEAEAEPRMEQCEHRPSQAEANYDLSQPSTSRASPKVESTTMDRDHNMNVNFRYFVWNQRKHRHELCPPLKKIFKILSRKYSRRALDRAKRAERRAARRIKRRLQAGTMSNLEKADAVILLLSKKLVRYKAMNRKIEKVFHDLYADFKRKLEFFNRIGG